MATFTYTALDGKGKRVGGASEGTSTQAVRKVLKEQGLYPIAVIARQTAGNPTFSPRRVGAEELVVAIREFATVINSGIPLDDAFTGVTSAMKEGRMKEIFLDIQRNIREGKSLSSSFADHPAVFSEMIVSMVRAGEESGTLGLILLRVADFLEKRVQFRNKMWGIMTYPLLMAAMAIMVLVFLLTYVTPTITRIFGEISLTLPLPTLILVAIGTFLKQFWFLLVLLIILAVIAVRRSFHSQRGKLVIDRLRFRTPLLSDLFIKGEIAAFSRTFATLLAGGVEILESMTISSTVVFSPLIRKELNGIRDFVSRGGSLSNGFQGSAFFPYLMAQLVNAGERSANLPEMFDKIASMYEEEVSQKSLRIVTFLEPLMILFMGIIVGFIVLAVLLPIFQISQSIK